MSFLEVTAFPDEIVHAYSRKNLVVMQRLSRLWTWFDRYQDGD